jgi:hypothetical protein
MQLLYIDLFCGAGGTSTGVETARMNGEQCSKVIACVNHDKNAIASHAANHPDALHFTEDIRTLELSPLEEHLKKCRAQYPDALVVLWASLECTNFSKAKGGQPRDADSRTLAEHLFRYIEAINPDYIQIENVEEFMSWGPLDENGKPVSKYKGESYTRWIENVCAYGYRFDHRILNSADFGAITSRKRFFGIFAKDDLPIVFPSSTHSKKPCPGKKNWGAVRSALDFEDKGKSMFGRKKPLVDASLRRIYAGLIKFVAGGKDAFLVKYNSMNQAGKYVPPSIDEPCPTVATQNRLGLASVCFLSKAYSGDPMSKNSSIDEPAGTITTIDHHQFISVHYGNGFVKSIDEPAPTITTKDRCALVNPTFIVNQYSGGGQLSSCDDPCPAITTNPKQNVVQCVMPSDYFLMNPQYSSPGGSIENPCFTLIARMDKMPPYLIEATHSGVLHDFITMSDKGLVYHIYDTDSEPMKQIKEFMALYNIVDIKVRMLRVGELKKIMGFPEDYVLIGTQAEQKKYIGNAVEVTMARVLCEALCNTLLTMQRKVA